MCRPDNIPAKKEIETVSTEQKKKSENDWSGGKGILPGRATVGPLLLMTTTPCFSISYFHVVSKLDGDFFQLLRAFLEDGVFNTLRSIWPDPLDPVAWKLIFGFMALQLFFMRCMPGKRFEATLTPKGNLPVYKANGLASYFATLGLLLLSAKLGYFRPALVYDKFGEILSSMNIFALIFCAMLVVKGHIAPSSTDSGSNGSSIIDFYWGMELYPRILGFDVKQFTNCRTGMMYWAVGILCYAHKNMELNNNSIQLGMAVNVALQLVYISKFFLWEMGYMCSMDIQHDRAGYYICWGCLVWVPSVYTSSSFYMATHAPDISPAVALAIFVCGLLMIWINYDADKQRYVFRQTKGECIIWGKKPRRIVAEYTSGDSIRKSLLLLDGWWGVSRHFHYMPEILGSFFWSLPALNTGLVGPYFYVIFLTILLTDRAFRDDDRCRKKYGPYWQQYCDEVPYKIVPYIV